MKHVLVCRVIFHGWIIVVVSCIVWFTMVDSRAQITPIVTPDVPEGRQVVDTTNINYCNIGNLTLRLLFPLLLATLAKLSALIPLAIAALAGISFLGLLAKKTLIVSAVALAVLIYAKLIKKQENGNAKQNNDNGNYHVHLPTQGEEHWSRTRSASYMPQSEHKQYHHQEKYDPPDQGYNNDEYKSVFNYQSR